jgi:hypothetical protein
MWKQTRGWNSNKGGKQAGMCLRNVRMGYDIASKYDDAWTAWTRTQQHKNRNYPAGVYAPIFFSYTATIDGVRKNYGHIGVRYPDGRFWSDGSVYASVEEYERLRAPVFVGWGESVNDVRVIEEVKGDDMTLSTEAVKTIYRRLLNREGDPGGIKNFTGKTLDFTLKDMVGSKEFKALHTVNNTVVVEKPVEVIKEVVKEVIVEKPVEVIKEVERVVEKPVPLADLSMGQLFEALVNKILRR